MFAGFVQLGGVFVGAMIIKNVNESPVNPDSPPICKVYGPGGLMQHGISIATKLDSDPGLYQFSVSLDPSNGYEVGTYYKVFINATVQGLTVAYEQSFIVT